MSPTSEEIGDVRSTSDEIADVTSTSDDVIDISRVYISKTSNLEVRANFTAPELLTI